MGYKEQKDMVFSAAKEILDLKSGRSTWIQRLQDKLIDVLSEMTDMSSIHGHNGR